MNSRNTALPLMLPRVTVIIVNYNYDKYLLRAFNSVQTQTYPEIEIVMVDDKSTDTSLETMHTISCEFPATKIVAMPENGGQSLASFAGLKISSGSYVLFLDADDELLPECIEAHVFAHLSSRIPVAFTSVDVFNNVDGRDTNISHDGFSQYIRSKRGCRPQNVRSARKSFGDSWFGQRPPALDASDLHFVLPPYLEPWVWSPTSANCYRRDAVTMLLNGPGLANIRWGTDAYLIRPLSSLFGSILVDRPLVRYTIHQNNRFVKGAPLNQFLFFDAKDTLDDMRTMARTGVEKLLSETATNGHRYSSSTAFFQAMEALGNCWPGPRDGEKHGQYYTDQLYKHRAALVTAFGKPTVDHILRQRPLGVWKKMRRLLRDDLVND